MANSQEDEHKTDSEAKAKAKASEDEGHEDGTSEDDDSNTASQAGNQNAKPNENDINQDDISSPSNAAAVGVSSPQAEGDGSLKEIKRQKENGPYDALLCPVSLFIAATTVTVFTNNKLTATQRKPTKLDSYKHPKLVLRNLCSKRRVVLHQLTKAEMSHSLVKFYSMHHQAFFEDFNGYYDGTALKQAMYLANSECQKTQNLPQDKLSTGRREDPSDVVLALFLFAKSFHLEPKTAKFSFYNVWYPLDMVSAAASKKSEDLDNFCSLILPFLPNLDEEQILILHPCNDPARKRKSLMNKTSFGRAQEHPQVMNYPPNVPAVGGASTQSIISDGVTDVDDKRMIEADDQSILEETSAEARKKQRRNKRKTTSSKQKYDDYDSIEDQSIDVRLHDEEEAPARIVDRLRDKEEEYEQRSKALAKATEYSKNLLMKAKELEELGMSSEVVDAMKHQAAQAMKEVLNVTSFPEAVIL